MTDTSFSPSEERESIVNYVLFIVKSLLPSPGDCLFFLCNLFISKYLFINLAFGLGLQGNKEIKVLFITPSLFLTRLFFNNNQCLISHVA